MNVIHPGADDAQALRRCVRELAALSTLSAVWSESNVEQIAAGLSGVLYRSLSAAVVYVRLTTDVDGAVDAGSAAQGPLTADRLDTLRSLLGPVLTSSATDTPPAVHNPYGDGDLRLLVTPLGLGGECGVVVVGSHQADFPTATDRLMTGVAANQAAVVLQQRRQKRDEETHLRLAAIVESSEDAIIGKDLQGTITSWNRGAERLYGYTADEIVGRPVSALIPPDHQDDFPHIMDRLRRGERVEQYETVRICKDGRRLDVALSVSPIRTADGTIQGASKIARDITPRKRADAALRRQTERLRLLWEAAAVLLTAEDADAMLRSVSEMIGPHLGVDAYVFYMLDESGVTLRLSSCEGVSPEAAHAMARLDCNPDLAGTNAAELRTVVATRIQESDHANLRVLNSGGIQACVCVPLVAAGRLLGTLSFASRTKDRLDHEEVAFIETVCQYVTVACERLRLLGELKQAGLRKDEFLAMLAHELRNPLAPIRSAVKILNIKGSPVPEARRSREIIERQLQHLTRLVDDLLDISRITRNKLVLQKSRIALAEVISGAVDASRPLVEQYGHDLTVALPAHPVDVDGDAVRLSQVFQNLLNNAAKYTEPGGRIWITAERQDDGVVVRVRDTGVGVPRDTLTRLFEMFYQADRSLERAQSGLGVGLALVRRIVEAHGGRVEAHSEGLGKGCEFLVYLPVLQEPAAALVPPAAGVEQIVSGLRILVADDNRDSADLFAMFLGLMGNDVRTAYDGVASVEEAERFMPDAVLLDIGMPRLNGEDACRRMRATPWGKHAVLIAVTGWDHEENRRRIFEAGFDAHLVKPADPAKVSEVLASLLRARREKPHSAARTTRS